MEASEETGRQGMRKEETRRGGKDGTVKRATVNLSGRRRGWRGRDTKGLEMVVRQGAAEGRQGAARDRQGNVKAGGWLAGWLAL